MNPKSIYGNLSGENQKHAIIVSRFNEFITESLLKGALDSLERHGVLEKNVLIVRVPGAYEIPVVSEKLAKSKKYDSIICLGAVIKGSTAHFDYVASESSRIGQVAVNNQIPIVFGVLTTDTIEQAIERAGTKAGNKGFEAATTAIEMVNVMRQLA
jgi:6,7-dimethyl-8-ribityllumazine synthase